MAYSYGTYPPAPFLRGKGSKVPLMAYSYGYSDGVERGHKAIKKTLTPFPRKTHRHSPLPRRKGARG